MIKNEQERQRIGQHIAQLRKEKGMTQLELAKEVGLSYAWVSQLEKGKKLPLETLMKFCSVLDKDPNYFLMDTKYVPEEVILNRELGRKLKGLDRNVIVTLNGIVDLLIKQHEEDKSDKKKA